MPKFTKNCDLCGKEFSTNYQNKLYCSDECRHKMVTSNRLNPIVKEKKKPISNMTRSEIEAEARKVGMHYGQYVGLKGL